MSEAVVYRLRWDDLDRFQAYLYDLPESELVGGDLFTFDGRARSDAWVPLPVYSESPRRQAPDIWHLFGAAVLVMGQTTIDLLEPYVSTAGELLPLRVSGSSETVYALNVLRDIDVLDLSRFSIETLELYPDFIEHRLGESGLFKVPIVDTTTIFCLEREDDDDPFRARVERCALTGIVFQRVWSSVDGPASINLMRA